MSFILKKIKNRISKQKSFFEAVEQNNIDYIKTMLIDEECDHIFKKEHWFLCVFKEESSEISNLLWNDKRVKKSLKNNNPDLYNKLKNFEKIKNNLEVF